MLTFTAALGQDPYNIDYAEHVKGGILERNEARPAKSDSAVAATTI